MNTKPFAHPVLTYLCLAIGSTSKVTLQRANQSMAQRRTDKEAYRSALNTNSVGEEQELTIRGQFESLVVTLDRV